MTGLAAFTVLVALVGLERLAELVVSKRNAAWSLERGGRETGRGHYPVMVVLHSGLLVGDARRGVGAPPGGAARARLVDAGAGARLAGAALVVHRHPRPALEHPGDRRARPGAGRPAGPTGCFPHPNYVAVVVEGVALPLVHAAWITALVFTVANAVLLTVRIRVENAALATAAADADRRCVTSSSPAAGPVGLATALYAARAGLDVAVREPRAGVIDKACGEGLMPGAVAALTELGVRLDGQPDRRHPLRRRHAHDADAPFRARSRPRRTAHRRCTRRSPMPPLAAGVTTEQRAVRTVEDRGDHVLVDGEPTRYLVAADGLHSPVRRLLGLDAARRRAAPLRPALPRRGARRGPRWSRCTGRRSGEAYVTPVAPDRSASPCSATSGAVCEDLLEAFPLLHRAAGGPGRLPGARRRTAAAARAAPGRSAGCCWSATPPATSTR